MMSRSEQIFLHARDGRLKRLGLAHQSEAAVQCESAMPVDGGNQRSCQRRGRVVDIVSALATVTIVAISNLPGPGVVFGLAVWEIVQLGPAPKGETDATGTTIVVYTMGGMMIAALMIGLGVPAACVALKLSPAPKPRN